MFTEKALLGRFFWNPAILTTFPGHPQPSIYFAIFAQWSESQQAVHTGGCIFYLLSWLFFRISQNSSENLNWMVTLRHPEFFLWKIVSFFLTNHLSKCLLKSWVIRSRSKWFITCSAFGKKRFGATLRTGFIWFESPFFSEKSKR